MSKSYVDIQRMQQSQVSNGERNAIRDSTEDIAGRKAQDLTKNQLHTRQKDDRFEARPGPSKNDHFISTPPLTRTTILPSNVVREEIIPGSGLCYIYDDGTVLRKSDDGELRNPSGSKPRKRVGQACNSCRERRIGCDQRKPKCLRCEYSGRQCIYETTSGKCPYEHGLYTDCRADFARGLRRLGKTRMLVPRSTGPVPLALSTASLKRRTLSNKNRRRRGFTIKPTVFRSGHTILRTIDL